MAVVAVLVPAVSAVSVAGAGALGAGAVGPAVRDCRARVTATCEQVTADPHAICGACADQLDGFLAATDGAPF